MSARWLNSSMMWIHLAVITRVEASSRMMCSPVNDRTALLIAAGVLIAGDD